MKVRLSRQFICFSIVGALGYIVDVLVFKAIFSFGAGAICARLLSFMCAVVFTWTLNRTFSFSSSGRVRQALVIEFVCYLSAMVIGGGINVGSSLLLMYFLSKYHVDPSLPIAFGSIAGMFFNFYSSKKWVFRPRTIKS